MDKAFKSTLLSNGYTTDCPPLRGDNPRALAIRFNAKNVNGIRRKAQFYYSRQTDPVAIKIMVIIFKQSSPFRDLRKIAMQSKLVPKP